MKNNLIYAGKFLQQKITLDPQIIHQCFGTGDIVIDNKRGVETYDKTLLNQACNNYIQLIFTSIKYY